MNKKFKMMMLTLGVAISTGAFALPSAKICDAWAAKCDAGNEAYCQMWVSGHCGTAIQSNN